MREKSFHLNSRNDCKIWNKVSIHTLNQHILIKDWMQDYIDTIRTRIPIVMFLINLCSSSLIHIHFSINISFINIYCERICLVVIVSRGYKRSQPKKKLSRKFDWVKHISIIDPIYHGFDTTRRRVDSFHMSIELPQGELRPKYYRSPYMVG